MSNLERPSWLEYPDSRVKLELKAVGEREQLSLLCNPQGLGSLTSALLWLSAYTDPTSLSLSGLPFVRATGKVALSVVMANDRDRYQGRIVRTDRDSQFEWQVHYLSLREVAIELFRVAVEPDYVDVFRPHLDPRSDLAVGIEIDSTNRGA